MKYPILLVHGMGFRDNPYFSYWGRIPAKLESIGCKIFYGYQDSNADVATNGQHIAQRIREILRETGAEKVNIIAHSKGGLDSRYAISSCDIGDKVASLTTLATPHHGSVTVDRLLSLPDGLVRFAGFCADVWFRVLGDKAPNSYKVFHLLSTDGANSFNQENPDHPAVYYQSYAFVMNSPISDILMWLPNIVVARIEGENDGLLSPRSVEWGDFKGIYRGAGRRGVSHCDEIDLRRKAFYVRTEDAEMDIVDLYCHIVRELSDCGF